MRQFSIRPAIALLAILLASCASKFDQFSISALASNKPFLERHKQVAANKYYIEEMGNGFSDHQALEPFFTKKAEELCTTGVLSMQQHRGTRFPNGRLDDIVMETCFTGGWCNATLARFPLVYGTVECVPTPNSTLQSNDLPNPSFQRTASGGR